MRREGLLEPDLLPLHLSVPSSSGNVVRLGRIGVEPLRSVSFQSPPHRGTSCDCQLLAGLMKRALTFSPLLIGERRATLADLVLDALEVHELSVPSSSGNVVRPLEAAAAADVRIDFQSPPHRGTSCDSRSCIPSTIRCRLSVPSSSGNVVRPYVAYTYTLAGGQKLSVPSSSGNVVRPPAGSARR